MKQQRILVVEDDRDIQELLRYHLEKHGYAVECAANGANVPPMAKKSPPNLILLDLMLPGMDGLEVCRQLKAAPATAGIPVIMVSARGEEADIVTGLELGAVDYICKPFRPREVMARVKAGLRRVADERSDAAAVNYLGLRVDPARHAATIDGQPLDLTSGEFRLLLYFAKRPGRVFTRDQIIDAVRGEDYSVTDRAVDVQIVGLRRKLGDYGAYVETVRGVGYRMKSLE
ncbi:MAG: response regulator transcription factor [Kiritimatiellaeota bacterium]|nr:response regulator transcription factor [Kiritimatiellota bacterium]